MAPKKAVQKPRMTLEPKQGFKKKTPAVKPIGAKLKTLPIPDLLKSDEVNLASENLPKNITRSKHPNNLNGIKAVNACKATDESNNLKETPSKAKRMKAANKEKLKKNELIITKQDDIQANSDVLRNVAKDIPPRIKKGRTACKQNNNAIKIMLANEVIRSALAKKTNIVKNVNQPVLAGQVEGMKRPVRPGRNKAINKPNIDVQNANNELNTLNTSDGPERIQDVAKKKPLKYAPCRRKSIYVPPEEVPHDDEDDHDGDYSPVTPVAPKKRKILSLKRQTKPVIDQASQNTHTVTEAKEETKECASVDNNTTLFHSNGSTAPDSNSKVVCGTLSPKPNSITCRRNSGTSSSTCFSWTKDISSTSTITCVTVKSSDFVRIDKRLPIVKLTNVDHQIRRRNTVDSVFDENSCDAPFHEDLKYSSECGSVSITNLNVHTLNLSTSSLTSVPSNRISENNRDSKGKKDEGIIKLEQSLESLFCKMKNFDTEIIKWIGNSNGNKDLKFENLHAGLFKVLTDENDVIRYCNEINRVLVGYQQDTEIKEIETTHSEQAAENLADVNSSRNNMSDSQEQKYVHETNSGSEKDTDTKNIPHLDEELNESKSFDKHMDVPDNDDDDALSLFAESLTGLESSRKNSSIAVSVSNDKCVTKCDLDASLRKNGRVIKPITYFDHEEPNSSQIVNDIKKQRADSSTAFNIPSYSGKQLKSKYKIVNRTHVNRFSDIRKVQALGVSYNDLPNSKDTTVGKELNRTLFRDPRQFSNTHTISPIDANSRSDEFEIPRAGAIPCSSDDNNFDSSEDVSGIPVSTSENWDNRTRLTQDNINAESVGESENSNLVIAGEKTTQSAANLLAMAKSQLHMTSSSIFSCICLYNLVATCLNNTCSFLHTHIDVNIVRSKLQAMDEEVFVKEVMFVCKWHMLKLNYGMCYIDECIRRKMTILLLILVRTFVTKINKKNPAEGEFGTAICEAALLHLNNADLQPSAEVLRSHCKQNVWLGDHLMKTLSETQNFSRFKNVFIKLTLFLCDNGRSFRLSVATQLVERLCILPYDGGVIRALVKVIANTMSKIYNVPMMMLLEGQLAKNDTQLYNELIKLKLKPLTKDIALPIMSPGIALSNPGYQTSTPTARADSPDTTNTDFVNKTTEPIITRTITINRTINTSNLNLSTGSESSEERPRYQPRTPHVMLPSYPPSLMSLRPLRPPRHLFKRGGYPARPYFGSHPISRYVCKKKSMPPATQDTNQMNYLRRPPPHPY